MAKDPISESAKITSNGRVTIPKDVRDILGISSGDQISFVVDEGRIYVFKTDSLLEAVKASHKAFQDKAHAEMIPSEEEIIEWVHELRQKEK